MAEIGVFGINGRLVSSKKERRRVAENNKRALRVGQTANLSLTDWALRLAQFQFTCAYCGEPYTSMDHIVPLANGGGTTFMNVVPCCAKCNAVKGEAVWLPARV